MVIRGEYRLLLFWRSAKFLKVYGTLKISYLSYIASIHKSRLVSSDKWSSRASRPLGLCLFWYASSFPFLEEAPGYMCGQDVLFWTVYYLNKGGDTRSRNPNQLARELTLWCIRQRISLMVVQLAGVDNVEADCLSRHRVESMQDRSSHQVVSKSGDSPPPFQYVRYTYIRHVCHMPESKDWGVLLSPSRPSEPPRESPGGRLVEGTAIHVPPLALLSLALHKKVQEQDKLIAIIPW